MYQSLTRRHEARAFRRGYDPVRFHTGDRQRFLTAHERHVARSMSGQDPDEPPVRPWLLRRIADARTMRLAMDDLLARGRTAPGPDGLCLHDLTEPERWELSRCLAHCIRGRTFRPGPARRVRIPKGGKPGEFRELAIRNTTDRVVGRATVLILQPLLERVFCPFSFGFRPGLDTQAALATALAIGDAQGRWAMVSADIEKAFDRVPHTRLLDACRRYFDEDLLAFIDVITYAASGRGQPQGSPESPMFFNLFAHCFIDLPSTRRRPDRALLRYADDLLLPCRDLAEAADGYASLAQLLRSAGTPLKESVEEAVVDLRNGQALDWLGYHVRTHGDGIPSVEIGERAWWKLEEHLAEAHLHPDAPLRAHEIVLGWLTYLAPAFAAEDPPAVVERVRRVAAAAAFDELPRCSELIGAWSAAHARWHRVRERETQLLGQRLAWARDHGFG